MATVLSAYSFDRGNAMVNDADCSNPSYVVASTSYAHTGSYAMRLGGGITAQNAWVRYGTTGAGTTPAISVYCYLGQSYNSAATATTGFNIRFHLTTGEYVGLRWNATTHTLDAYVNSVLAASGTVSVPNNTWFSVQAYVSIADAGNIQVLIDGHSSIAHPCDTQPGGAATCDYIYLHGRGGGSRASDYDYFDDLVVGYGGLLGPCRCYEAVPDGDTATVQFTPSTAGAHYVLVDETPASDTGYNYTSVTNRTDLLTLSDVDLTGMDILAVVPWARAFQSEGSGDSIIVGADSSGTESVATFALSNSAQYFHHALNIDPHTTNPWLESGVDALKLLYRSSIT